MFQMKKTRTIFPEITLSFLILTEKIIFLLMISVYKNTQRENLVFLVFFFCSMFVISCKRLRIMKGSEARGLGCGV